MRAKHLGSALGSALACALLAASCVQSPESPPIDGPLIETTDDNGEFGGDPDVGGGVGSDPDVGGSVGDPAYSWSPPSGTPSDGDVGDSESEPDAASSGGDAMWGYGPRSPVRSPGDQPANPCAEKCARDFEGDAGRCIQKPTEAQRRECQGAVLASYKDCQGTCRRKQGDPCVEDCEWEKKDCDDQCRKIPEKKKREREACWAKCEREYADCLKKCKD
jgi:hypothetical protein